MASLLAAGVRALAGWIRRSPIWTLRAKRDSALIEPAKRQLKEAARDGRYSEEI